MRCVLYLNYLYNHCAKSPSFTNKSNEAAKFCPEHQWMLPIYKILKNFKGTAEDKEKAIQVIQNNSDIVKKLF